MLGQMGEIQRNIQGIGILVGSQRPFVSFLLKNWPLTAIAAVALGVRGYERYKKHELTSYNILADAGLILSPLIGLALINQIAQQDAMFQAQMAAAQAGAQTATPQPTPAAS
jgi:hypothetical protein